MEMETRRAEIATRRRFEEPKNSLQTGSIRGWWTPSLIAPPLGLGKQGLYQFPLFARKQLLPFLHGTNSTVQPPYA
jgi:hypothetical protein